MVRPTHDEIIRQLSSRVEVIDDRVERCEADISVLPDVRVQLAVLISEMAQVKKELEETSRRRWSLVPVLVGALLGGFFVILAQFLAAALRK